MIKISTWRRGGFTLLELLVSLGIFSTILLVAVGGFVKALRTERQLSQFAAVNGNISLTLEQIAREIRTGVDFCTNGSICPSPDVLSFVNARGETVTYCLDDKAIKRIVGSGPCAAGQKITANNIDILNLEFVLLGNFARDGFPPRVTILVGAAPKDASVNYVVNLQTTVSSRVLDS
jgi:prepilin-type N-terminal cleavage/methylation domain-containing protein